MSEMKMDKGLLDRAMKNALLDSVLLLQERIIEITPRDPARPPKDMDIHVTGDLKRSIDHQQVGEFEFIIGTKQGDAEYGKFLEFGTVHMEPRSFLRKGLIDSKDEVLKNFGKIFNRVINGK